MELVIVILLIDICQTYGEQNQDMFNPFHAE